MRIARILCTLLLLAAADERALAQGEGWLGLSVIWENYSTNTGKRIRLPDEVRVVSVSESGPAASAGIQVDDVILALDHDLIPDGRELSEKVRSKEPGSAVLVRVKRREDILEFKAVLGTQPRSRELLPGERRFKVVPIP